MVYKKIRKILLAHGLPNAQYLLAPLDFYSPRATGQVEMSNPVIVVITLYYLAHPLRSKIPT